jgi:hypothetical protein
MPEPTQGGGGRPPARQDIAGIFWSASPPESEDRTPQVVVRHALSSINAFEAGSVNSRKTGKPLSLMQLVADMGIEENLIYASPELARGEPFDERSLVFTLGVLIFERLTDRHPFGTPDNPERVARIRRYEMGSGVNFFPSVPKELRSILMRAMGPFPEERYHDLLGLKHDLARFGGVASAPGKPSGEKRPKFFDAPTVVAPPILDFNTGEDELTPVETATPSTPALQAVPTLEVPPRRDHLERSSREEAPTRSTLPGISAPAAPRPASAPTPRSRRPSSGTAPVKASPPEPVYEDDAATRPGQPLPARPKPSADALAALSKPATGPAQAAVSVSGQIVVGAATPPPATPSAPATGTSSAAPAPPPAPGTVTPAEAALNRLSTSELFGGIADHSAPHPLPIEALGDQAHPPAPVPAPVAGSARIGPPPSRLSPLLYAAAGALVATGVFFLITSLGSKDQTPVAAIDGKSAPKAEPKEAPKAEPKEAPKAEPKEAPKAEPKEAPKAEPKEAPKAEPKEAPKAEPKPQPKTEPKPKPPLTGEAPEIRAGRQVGEAIRPCGVGQHGARSLRVAAVVQPTGRVVRSFANKKQGVSDRQLGCIRKALAPLSLPMGWSETGFIEWSLRIFDDRVEAQVAGPRELKERLQKAP